MSVRDIIQSAASSSSASNPASTTSNVNAVFKTYLYTGNGSTQTITTGIDLAGNGGLVWVKARGVITDHVLIDTVRGGTKMITSDAANLTITSVDAISSFNSTGYSFGIAGGGYSMNTSSVSYVSWIFRNAAKFFDVVTYMGDGTTNRTVAHNLGVTPGCIIVKSLTTTDTWSAWHNSYTGAGLYPAMSTVYPGDTAQFSTSQSSTTINLAASNLTNLSGQVYVAYVFAHDTAADSMIKCGSYTGNGSTTGPIVSLGWEPQYLMIKNVTGIGSWQIVDNMRGLAADGNNAVLNADTTAAEFTGTFVASTSTGFQLKTAAAGFNSSGATYIYIAIRAPTASASLYGNPFFSTYLYTGNGTSQTITNGIDLAGNGGIVWLKCRNAASQGIICRPSYRLYTSVTNGEEYSTNVTAFNSDGFSVGSDVQGNILDNTYVSWTFRKAAKFFDIVTYTGDGTSVKTLSHSLGIIPGMTIIKRTNAAGPWIVSHNSYGNWGFTAGYDLLLNSSSWTSWWNGPTFVAPTATQFTVGTSANEPGDSANESGATYVAYVFAHDTAADSMIKCGKYTGNGSATGPIVSLGWEPEFLLIKNATGVGSWQIIDNMRGMTADGNNAQLNPDTTAAEFTGTNVAVTSTGFQLISALSGTNASGATYIYMAIRRPTNLPTSGTQVYKAIARAGTASAATVTGVGFSPDMVISKDRTIAYNTAFFDRLRGATKLLVPSLTSAEAIESVSLIGFDVTDGVRLGVDYSQSTINYSGNYINHFFKRAPGFFDIVCWTGTGSSQAVNHSLGVIPELLIYRSRTVVTYWGVVAIASTGYGGLKLDIANGQNFAFDNTDAAVGLTSTTFNPVYSFGNTSTPSVAYLFATLAGISKVGSYTGNGSTQTINCGFAAGARFILIKRIDASGDWYVWDTVRGIVGGNDPHLSLNNAEEVTTDDSIDPDNSGFIVNQLAATNINVTSATYIFLTIA